MGLFTIRTNAYGEWQTSAALYDTREEAQEAADSHMRGHLEDNNAVVTAEVVEITAEEISTDREIAAQMLAALREAHVSMWGIVPKGQDRDNMGRMRAARDQVRAALRRAEGRAA